MDLTHEAKYHQLEEQHGWFASRRDAVLSLIQQLRLPTSTAILEIGCSGGPLLRRRPQLPGLLNQVLLAWVRAENVIMRHLGLPLGVSVFALARKPA